MDNMSKGNSRWPLLLLSTFTTACLLALPASVKAQFMCTTNPGNTLTIVGYDGTGGNVTIPTQINGFNVAALGDEVFYQSQTLTSITIPQGIGMGDANFLSCEALTNVVLPDDLTSIGVNEFSGCGSLANITLPSSLNSIGDEAFAFSALTNIVIPSDVTNIGQDAFNGCAYLRTASIPGRVSSIGTLEDGTFTDCSALTTVTIGNGVKSIGGTSDYQDTGAFESCTSLTNISFPASLSYIGYFAFASDSSLTTITIPSRVTNIEFAAFRNCTKLKTIYFLGPAPAIDPDAFDGVNATIYYLPTTTGWSSPYAGLPAVPWLPQIVAGNASFGLKGSQFGFTVDWASGQMIEIDATSNLNSTNWTNLGTATISNGVFNFSETFEPNAPARFYRVRSP